MTVQICVSGAEEYMLDICETVGGIIIVIQGIKILAAFDLESCADHFFQVGIDWFFALRL